MKNIIEVKDKEHLKKLIKDEINLYGDKCDLNHFDVSNVKDMNHIFSRSKFNGDISKWDVSNVTNMNSMFWCSKFKGDLSDWLPYKLEDKNYMFYKCSAPEPYWYNADNIQKAIETYQLKNKLEDKLGDINKSVNKIKI